jgi:hypothetical protein
VPQVSSIETAPLAGGFPPAFFSETQLMVNKNRSDEACAGGLSSLLHSMTSLAYLPLASTAYRVAFTDDPSLTDDKGPGAVAPAHVNDARCMVSRQYPRVGG